jgi:hypothetical protein
MPRRDEATPSNHAPQDDTNDELWHIVDSARNAGAPMNRLDAIRARLATLPPNRIVAFERGLREAFAQSYTEELWGAAYLINGGCSDDGFEYFRGFLIVLGSARFREAVASPDSLADVDEIVSETTELEETRYVAMDAYRSATGNEMPELDLPPYPTIDFTFDFEDEDEMRRRYPRLYARFGP